MRERCNLKMKSILQSLIKCLSIKKSTPNIGKVIVDTFEDENEELVQRATDVNIHYFCMEGLSEQEINEQIDILVNDHIKEASKRSGGLNPAEIHKMCSSRMFLVKYSDYIIVCGLYSVRRKRNCGHETACCGPVGDYLLYSEVGGFFFVRGCSVPSDESDFTKCISPSIYYENKSSKELLKYGMIYDSRIFHHIYFVFNAVIGQSDTGKIYDVRVFVDSIESMHFSEVTLFSELRSAPGYFVCSTDRITWNEPINSSLVNCFLSEKIPLLLPGWHRGHYGSKISLSTIMTYVDNEQLRISDSKNIYFYICKNHTVAFDAVMRCAEMYGSIRRMNNLFREDASVNYQICFSREIPTDVINFVFGVISKSKVLYPVIMGCPLHDVIEVLSRETSDSKYDLLQRKNDEISAQRVVDYIQNEYGKLPSWEIIRLLCITYGSYSTAPKNEKYMMYYYGEALNCDYLPTSMSSVIGEPINGDYVRRLDRSTINAKWKSELLLFQLVFAYYPDAKMHYYADWLKNQHLDIFIPSLLIGIEYQGQQHYEANDFFGGTLGFEYRQRLDNQKEQLCKENNIVLIKWMYSVPITPINLIYVLSENGVLDVPIPDPFNLSQSTDEEIPPEKTTSLICQYSTDGSFLDFFHSYADASAACGISASSIQLAVTGHRKTAGSYQWRRILESDTIEDIPPVTKTPYTNTPKAVYQISYEGEVVAEYASMGEAAKKTGINKRSIRDVLSGRQKQAGGFYWVEKK